MLLRCALLCAPAVFCASCSERETPAEKAVEEKILLVGNAADPATLDPTLATGVTESKILNGLFEGLVTADTSTLEVKPAVAKSWEISEDGLTYTFYLDEKAKWSDGSRVTAGDFVFAMRRAVNPVMGSEYVSMLMPIKNARKIASGETKDFSILGATAISDNILKIELEEPVPYFLSMLYHGIYFPLPQKTLEKFGAAENRDALWTRPQNMVSNGPFVLAKWNINDKVSIRKNPLYRDAESIRINGVDFFPISNINTEDRAFRAGQLHITESVAPTRMDAIRRDMPQNLRRDDWLGVYYYLINTRRPPLDDARVRKALALAIDRKAIIDTFLKAGQNPATSFVPQNCDGYVLDDESKIREDIAKAKKLLAEAGYPDGKGFPNIRLTYNTSELHKPIAEAIQQMWKKNLGVTVEMYNLSWPAYLAARREGDFDIARASWVGDFAAPESFLQVFESDSGLNHSGFVSKKYDELIKEAADSKSRAGRLEKLAAAERELMDAMPVMPIYFYAKVYLISPDVKGWNANLLDYHNFKNVRLEGAQ